MQMKNQLLLLLNTNTLKESSITGVATVVNGVLGVIFYITVARELGPAGFGIFAVAIAALTLIADIANLGTDTGLIRFIGKYRLIDRIKTLKFLKLGVEVKIIAWIVILVVGWFLVPSLSRHLFLKDEFTSPLKIALLGIGGVLLFSFATSGLQAYQKYFSWSFVNIGSNSLRLLVLFGLLLMGNLSLNSSLLTYTLVPFAGFIVALTLLPKFIFVKREMAVAAEFFHYNKWVALFIVMAAISSRLDTFLVARFLPSISVGIYSAANQLTAVVPQLVFAIATVVAPKLAGFTNHADATAYLTKLQFLVLGIAGLGLLLLPFALYLIPLLFGQVYQQSVGVFVILFFAQLIFLVSLPFHQAIFYYFAKPSVFVIVSVVHLFIISTFGWFLIPTYGIYGGATTVLLGSISNFILPAIWVVRQFKKN